MDCYSLHDLHCTRLAANDARRHFGQSILACKLTGYAQSLFTHLLIAPSMASMLQLPRELYLEICSYLQPPVLANLSGVSRDHYLAVQEPLYARIRITKYKNLIKLVNTLQKAPLVSFITPHQRLRWYKLSDAQLRERDIKHLYLNIDGVEIDSGKLTSVVLAQCIGAIARKCWQVRIELAMYETQADFLRRLQGYTLPNVIKLTAYWRSVVGHAMTSSRTRNDTFNRQHLWELLFAGSVFPDLQSVYLNGGYDRPDVMPKSLDDLLNDYNSPGRYDYDTSESDVPSGQVLTPFYGLRAIREIVVTFNASLTPSALTSLFSSDIIPQHLTRLHIVGCHNLHPVRDLKELSILLQRALYLVKDLKLYLASSYDDASNRHEYEARLAEYPNEHICNIIRELGPRVPSIDLMLPFVCNRLFQPLQKRYAGGAPRDYPTVPREPLDTLPARLQAEGYKYRRVMCRQGVCREAHEWTDMFEYADTQSGDVSWELMQALSEEGSWHVSGCLPVKFRSDDVLLHPFSDAGKI